MSADVRRCPATADSSAGQDAGMEKRSMVGAALAMLGATAREEVDPTVPDLVADDARIAAIRKQQIDHSSAPGEHRTLLPRARLDAQVEAIAAGAAVNIGELAEVGARHSATSRALRRLRALQQRGARARAVARAAAALSSRCAADTARANGGA